MASTPTRIDVRLTDAYVADARLVADGTAQPEDALAVFAGRAGRGRLSPFSVHRSYTGAGGWYVEVLTLLAPNGDIAWRGPERTLQLRGSNKIDSFTSVVDDAAVATAGDHELVFLLHDGRRRSRLVEVARVPLAVLDQDPPYLDAAGGATAVLTEALRKGTIVWVTVPGADGPAGRGTPVWYGLHDGRVYVLTGGGEQQVPGLASADLVLLTARSKDQQSRVADLEAAARVVAPSEPLFDQLVAVLLPRRLNLRDGDAAAARWRKECTLVELTPTGVAARTASPVAPVG